MLYCIKLAISRFISLGQSIWGEADLVVYLRIRVTRGNELRAAPHVQSSSARDKFKEFCVLLMVESTVYPVGFKISVNI